MKQFSGKAGGKDPFLVTTRKTLDGFVIKEFATEWLTNAQNPVRYGPQLNVDAMKQDLKNLPKLADPIDKDNWLLFGGSRGEINKHEARERFLQRVGMAAIGGAFLIGPMLIMVLHESRVTSLVTSSVCVAAFGLVVVVYLEKPFDVLSATAAYAAVLVVFVGTSGGANTSTSTGAS